MNGEARYTRKMLDETLSNGKFALVAAKSTGQRVAIRLYGYNKEECFTEESTAVGNTTHVWAEASGLYTWAIHHATFIKYVDTLPINERVHN